MGFMWYSFNSKYFPVWIVYMYIQCTCIYISIHTYIQEPMDETDETVNSTATTTITTKQTYKVNWKKKGS